LHVITDTDRRGAQLFGVGLAEAMAEVGHDVRTVALAGGNQAEPIDVEVLGPWRRSPQTIRALRRLMSPADVTIAHGSATALACALAGWRHRPFIYRQISDSRFWAATRRRRWRVSRYLRRARIVVALSEAAKLDLVDYFGLDAESIRVVPNGVHVQGFDTPTPAERARAREHFGVPPDQFVGLVIGALVPEKGAADAVDAVSQLDGMHLIVVGEGPERSRLEDMAQGSSPNRIHLVGPVQETWSAYAAADVHIFPSRGGDSMPATLIEASLCGVPSVTTSIGSVGDIVIHERTGLIVDDGVDHLVRALERMRNDTGWRSTAGAAAREHCMKFEIGTVTEAWLRVVHEVDHRAFAR
jgi:glycosyltransferase involved in cell wall biosynthesis